MKYMWRYLAECACLYILSALLNDGAGFCTLGSQILIWYACCLALCKCYFQLFPLHVTCEVTVSTLMMHNVGCFGAQYKLENYKVFGLIKVWSRRSRWADFWYLLEGADWMGSFAEKGLIFFLALLSCKISTLRPPFKDVIFAWERQTEE